MSPSENYRTVAAVAVALVVVLAGCGGGGGAGDAGGAAQLGYAAGGASDVGNFRRNVREGYLPQPTDLTFEGLFGEYAFDTGGDGCEQSFCPAYSTAVASDPLSNRTERYLAVGLNSNRQASEFERKKLNLVVVLDTSGSMGRSIDRYADSNESDGGRRSKMATAKRAVAGLADHLREGDRFGVVGYDDTAGTVVPMHAWGEYDPAEVRTAIGTVEAGGGTNLEAGMERATSMVRPYADANATEYETRVVYVTDAMPNEGETSAEALGSRVRENARDGVYSTFVGVGVDFNTRLVESINDVEGANHYTVDTAAAFRERMDEGFEYMVTPLVFDLELSIDAGPYRIEKVYGAPSANESTGSLLHVNTLFPARTTNGSTRGGVILVRLERTGASATPTAGNGSVASAGENGSITLTARYEDRRGTERAVTRNVTFRGRPAGHFETEAVRKAVVLSQYGDLLKHWLAYEREQVAGERPPEPVGGIDPYRASAGDWEQRSVDLRVSEPYADRLRRFREHFRREVTAIGDGSLRREVELLGTILNASTGGAERTE